MYRSEFNEFITTNSQQDLEERHADDASRLQAEMRDLVHRSEQVRAFLIPADRAMFLTSFHISIENKYNQNFSGSGGC